MLRGEPVTSNGAERGQSPVQVAELYRAADLRALDFETTAQLEPLEGVVAQPRALDAIRLGAAIDKAGFNIFAIGRPEARMRPAVETVLRQNAGKRAGPRDWIYVNNFKDAHRPVAIALPAGRAVAFREAMTDLIEDLKVAVPAVFESEEYQTQRAAIEENARKPQNEALEALQQKAAAQDVGLVRTPMGFALVPIEKGEVVPPSEFNQWPEAKRQKVQERIEVLEKELEHFIRQIPQWEKGRREAVRELNRRTTQGAVGHLIDDKRSLFGDVPRIVSHLDQVQADLVDNIAMFIPGSADGENEAADTTLPGGPFDRYQVNVLVAHESGASVQIIEELHPTLANLTGSIEHLVRQGALVTNFRLIKAGALHRANGGYLLLDARNLVTEPFSWSALKRVLRRREIVIEDVSRLLGLSSTASLEPDPIPLDIRVVLFGDRLLYFILAAFDPELEEHFKVLADFDDEVARSVESEGIFARFLASLIKSEGLKPMERGGVSRMIEHAARLADDAGKLTMLVDRMRDVLVEADHWAGEAGRKVTLREDVEHAIAERIRRASRISDRMQEMIVDRVALIETSGTRTGQINGLSVIELGGHAFGRPSRISCQVRPGTGQVVDIEREVELGGPIHSKGVLILAGFLSGRYALDTPMSLQASLVFEQSYGGVEGDSASSAELCALVSALAELPLRQDLAVTGSVNQHGEVQAIGGVNEKIEGFFDLCAARGLSGTQGVIIPRANVRHLMLRQDVVAACAAGQFAVHAVATIDEGLALMTGRQAGERTAAGGYPEGSVNRLVDDRLRAFAAVRRDFLAEKEGPKPKRPR